MHPAQIALQRPGRIAYIMAQSGQSVTYGELEGRASQGAHLFRSIGLRRGGHVALLMENHPLFLQICSAAQRSGLFYTAMSWRLLPHEIEYILRDCGATALIASKDQEDTARKIAKSVHGLRLYIAGGTSGGFESWEDAISIFPTGPIEDQSEGQFMLYSSGTTGKPKGVKRPLPEIPYGDPLEPNLLRQLYGIDDKSIYLSPAPIYHSAPLAYSMGCLREGATVVVMEHFDPELALRSIERYRVTHSQWVPTMFIRLLKLPEAVRERYDLSSQRCAIHAAAPCPVQIKRQMIDWWGPIVVEYYSGTEANGHIRITSSEWLAHPGSVGRPINCTLHICDDDGNELPTGERGTIYMEGGPVFSYHNDKEKTAKARHAKGWTTLRDVGYLDSEGFLYLTDRKDFTIISGGVNIYPQEAENVLITHPKVSDVAVFGVPNAEFGEEVKAVVQPADINEAGASLAAELIEFCRAQLAAVKCPRSIDFRAELPRHPTGKLYKRQLRDEYWRGDGA
jgi:long-chain acyl-CoA synthetase